LDLRNLIDLGGFIEGLQDTREDKKINRKDRGLSINRPPLLLPLDRTNRGGQGAAAALHRWRRRCSGELKARVRHKIERGARLEQVGVLTSGGERRGRPESEAAPAAWFCAAALADREQGRRLGGAQGDDAGAHGAWLGLALYRGSHAKAESWRPTPGLLAWHAMAAAPGPDGLRAGLVAGPGRAGSAVREVGRAWWAAACRANEAERKDEGAVEDFGELGRK
jgi:hypothetical protein